MQIVSRNENPRQSSWLAQARVHASHSHMCLKSIARCDDEFYHIARVDRNIEELGKLHQACEISCLQLHENERILGAR